MKNFIEIDGSLIEKSSIVSVTKNTEYTYEDTRSYYIDECTRGVYAIILYNKNCFK